jgi:hypothetical protein
VRDIKVESPTRCGARWHLAAGWYPACRRHGKADYQSDYQSPGTTKGPLVLRTRTLRCQPFSRRIARAPLSSRVPRNLLYCASMVSRGSSQFHAPICSKRIDPWLPRKSRLPLPPQRAPRVCFSSFAAPRRLCDEISSHPTSGNTNFAGFPAACATHSAAM